MTDKIFIVTRAIYSYIELLTAGANGDTERDVLPFNLKYKK